MTRDEPKKKPRFTQYPTSTDFPEPPPLPDTTRETVDELKPGMTGRWLVTTMGSQHVWDLDRWTYVRMPGEHSRAGSFDYDHVPLKIWSVKRWPKVDDYSFVELDSSYAEVQVRQSSFIRRIERLGPDEEVE